MPRSSPHDATGSAPPSSRVSAAPAAPPAGRARARQLAWALVPLLTLGLFAFVPFLRLALARRRQRDWAVCGTYLAASVAVIALISLTPSHSAGSELAGGLLLLLAGFGTVHTLVAFRPRAPWLASLAGPGWDPNRLAVARAEHRMRLRREAREIHADNPVLAGELKIGRPDLPRSYDDGGLVDVNHVPARVLASQLGLTRAEAAAVIAVRDRLGGFSSAEELLAYTDLTPDRVDGMRDWLIFDLPGGGPQRRAAGSGRRDDRARLPARSIDWAGAFQDRSSRAACGRAEQGEARRCAAACGA